MTIINHLQALVLAALILAVFCAHLALKTTGYTATVIFGNEAMEALDLGPAYIPSHKAAYVALPMKSQAIRMAKK